ncbi:MAG: Asp-tRNA(Asn)/Glu-tRNA(Gln) amidotransferase GatCAB subunit A [Chloroflexi bacterium]|nr:Asp-tRNA(Asn)/Glu-tRNA(Gln) amidotransferase GatCAB subunit A [Chloroflexota bacterium]
MNSADLHYLSIADLGSRIKSKEISPVEVTQAYLDRIEAQNERLGAYITVMSDAAMAQARAAEREIQSGQYRGRMHGIPVAVKDIIYTRGVLTSAGSRVLADHVPDEDSTLVERLDAAGAVLLGKLNLSEFAIGGTIDHPYGTPRNPWNTEHTAGGSSSGSGVATAGGLCAGALGSDTGGSIRGPAGFCGLAGIRPTYGRVTRHKVVPMCWSLDTVGPMTRTVEDCAIMLQAIAGHDRRDATSSNTPVPDYFAALTGDITGLRVALPREMFDFEALDSEVKGAVEKAVGVLIELGASSDEVSLPTSERSGAVFIANADVDCAAFHSEWLRTRPDDYDWNTRTRLESASLTPAVSYIKAQRARALIRRELMEVLAEHDVIVMPTGPVPAPTIEASTGKPGGFYQGKLDLGRRRYTSPAPLAGLPALSVNCGFSEAGLPIGMQIVAKPFAEDLLFRIGHAYEQATEWHTRHPDL